jgi:trk system potassium uptake protein TrkA
MGKQQGRRVLVVGCGRLGALLASRLSRRGIEVVVIDQEESAFATLGPEFSGLLVAGDATELSVLRRARAGEADAVLVTTRDDCTNLMVAQVAHQVLGARQALARVFDPTREAIYHGLGIATVCPTSLAADALMEQLAVALASAREDEPCA